MANINAFQMADIISADKNISVKKGFLGLSTKYVYIPTGSRIRGYIKEYSMATGEKLHALLDSPIEQIEDVINSFEESEMGNYRLEMCVSDDKQFVADKRAIGIGDIGFAEAYAFYLRARQYYSSGVSVDEEILKRRPLVLDADFDLLDFICHYLISPKIRGIPSLPLPTMTIFALGDSASFRVASMPFSRRILSLILALTILLALALPSASTR